MHDQSSRLCACGCGRLTRASAFLNGHATRLQARWRRPRSERFWEKVEKTDDCWWWRGANGGPNRYGLFQTGRDGTRKIKDYAHRVSYRLTYGGIPDGLWVCHRCDNRLCVRPDHLFLGTSDDNIRDKVQKGRSPLGEQNGVAKLSEAGVRAIRARYAAGGVSQQALADEYGVSFSLIHAIVRRKIWKHLH